MTLTVALSAARSFRAMLRRLAPGRSPRPPCPFVYVQAGPQGLVLSALMDEVALRWHRPGAFPNGSLGLPTELLDRFQGGGAGELSLEPVSSTQVRVRWQEAGVPQECLVNTVTPDGVGR